MKQRPVRTALGVVCVLLIGGLSAAAGGLYVGVPAFTLDLSSTLEQVPVTFNNVFDIVEATFIDWGATQAELDDMRAQINADLADGIESLTSTLPPFVPVPLVGCGFEFGLPLILIDGIRISGGWLSENLVRSISEMAGFPIPEPLFDNLLEAVDMGSDEYFASADLEFSAWALSTEVVKRLDLFILALDFGVGLDLIEGWIRPVPSYSLPPELENVAAGVLDALHLDELTWSGLAAHGMIGFEVGPPFLRLYGDVRWTIPLSQTEEWWKLRLGPVSALLGFVIRF